MDKKRSRTDNYSPYLKVLRVDVCKKCLQQGVIYPPDKGDTLFKCKCVNPQCELYNVEWTTPANVFFTLQYLQRHQPD